MRHIRQFATLTVGAGLALGIIASPAVAGTPTGNWEHFAYCPYENPEVKDCVYSETTSGEVAIGSTAVPITNKIILQGGATYHRATKSEQFFEAVNGGETLTKAPQNVPGGILGIVAPESFPWWLKLIFKAATENGATGVSATAEQVGAIELNKAHLAEETGVALKLPIRLHLENPFLGSTCYIGSSTDPITWNLTTGTTKPLMGIEPLTGASGEIVPLEEGELLKLIGNKLVENDYNVPKAEGCTEPFSLIIDPLINAKLGLESAAGNNKTILYNTIFYGSASKTKESAEKNG